MPSLSETQRTFRGVVTGGAPDALLAALRCPADPRERLTIYRRHHRESFRRHLRGRYPTLEWLLGTDRLVAIADATLRQSPPLSPSLAEYGGQLIATLAAGEEDLPPYAAGVAALDWALGLVSVAVDRQPLRIEALAAVADAQLPALTLELQQGLSYQACDWPVDTLFHLRLAGDAPERLAFAPDPVHLELRGGRGRFSIRRLDAAGFAFRAALACGESLGQAAEAALALEPAFDIAAALAALFAEGLVISHSGDIRHA